MEAYKQAIQLKPGYVDAYQNLGLAYAQLGHWQEAVEVYKQALQVKPDYVEAYNSLGSAYGQLGRWQEATEASKHALEIAREQKKTPAEATALMTLAWKSEVLGDFDNNQKYLLEAKVLYRSLGNFQQEAFILTGIGRLYLDMSRYDEALNFFHQALDAYREAKDLKGQRELFSQIGDVYGFWLSDAQMAMPWYQDALRVAKAAGDAPGELQTLAMFLVIDDLLGNQAALQEHAAQAGKIREEITQQLSLAVQNGANQPGNQAFIEGVLALARFAQIVGNLGGPNLAITWLNDALQVHQAFPKTRGFLKDTAIDLYYLGFAHGHLGHYDEALKDLHRAEEIAKQLNSPEIFRVISAIGWIKDKQGQLPEALTLYLQAAETFEKANNQQKFEEVKLPFQELGFAIYQNIVKLLLQLHGQTPEKYSLEQAFLYHEKGKARSLLDLLAEAKVHIREGIDPGLLKEEEQISTRIARLHRALAEPTLTKEQEKLLLVSLEEQEQALQALHVKMTVANPKYAELMTLRTADLPQLQATLDKDTLLLEYGLGEERSFLWAITQEDMHGYELPKREEVDRQVEQYLSTLKTPLFEKDEIRQHIALGKGLYQALVQPVTRQLQGKRKLIVVPDGSLYYLPFETLITGSPIQRDQQKEEMTTLQFVPYLLKDYTVSYSPSASIWMTLEKNRKAHPGTTTSAQSPLLAFGDPLYETPVTSHPTALNVRRVYEERGGGFQRLLYSAKEVEKIAKVYGITLPADSINLREKATTKRLHEMDLTQYRILHFATHAVMGDEIKWLSQPALVLSQSDTDETSDRFLRMEDIFNLRLNAGLVVLSACNTGKGKLVRGEGMIGLTRAFMYAGTPSVVASLWKVNDESTSLLMESFYQNLAAGQSKAEALQHAKTQLLQTLAWSDTRSAEQSFAAPYFWAPFALIGSGN